jgi:hypothetical protein
MPALADVEVLTMEVVGEYLGFGQDQALYRYFRRHYTHFFPALGWVHRTTFTRQAANLWKVKNWSGADWWIRYHTTPLLPWWTASPCPSVSSPELTGAAGSKGRQLSAGIRWSVRPSMASESMFIGAGLGQLPALIPL